MRASNVETITSDPENHGERNPNWAKYAVRVFAGTGRNAETVEMVPVTSCHDTNEVRGWTRDGRFVHVRNVRGHRPL